MTFVAPFLADTGVPPGLVFFGAFVGIWVLAALFGKKKPSRSNTPEPQANARWQGERQTRQQQWQTRLEQIAGGAVVGRPPPMPSLPRNVPTTVPMSKASPRAKAKQQPMPVREAARLAQQAASRTTIAKPAAPLAPRIAPPTDTARNLRLLLQRGGVREAVLLGEILSPPLSMRE